MLSIEGCLKNLKMTLLQAEIAKDLLNNNDATIQGILLAVIVILLTFIGLLWRAKLSDEKYIREQDKANLEMLLTVTNTVKDIGETSTKNGEKIDVVNIKASSILDIIKERLTIRK